jgi:hypothetical protein
MKIRTTVLAAVAALGLGLAAWIAPNALAQEWDVVHVKLPYTVTLGEKILPPGDYTIQPLRSEGSGVLLFYSANGMKFEISAMPIPAVYGNLDTRYPDESSVVLSHIGDDYYFDRIWIQGKDYGYEFPLPASAREREKELAAAPVTLPAGVSTTPIEAESADAAPVPSADNTAAPPEPEPAVAPPEPSVPPAEEPQTSGDTSQTTASPSEDSANREKQPDKMPATSAGWLAMLLAGGALSGAGLRLGRKR